MTLTEQKLCKLWALPRDSYGWWDFYQELLNIRDVLETVEQAEASTLFHEASSLALGRCTFELQNRVAA